MRRRLRWFRLLALGPVALLPACNDFGQDSQPIVPDRSVVSEHPMTPDQMRQMTGVDRLPQVLDKTAMKAAMDRSYPEQLRSESVSGSALVDVAIDAEGEVTSVTPVERPAGARAVMILENRDGTRRQVTPVDHPAFQSAAVRAMKEVRFSPAMRDGAPVPYTIRMTVTFDPPSGRR